MVRSRVLVRVAVWLLLAAYGLMAFTGSLGKGVAFDEGLQLAVGYNIWRNHDLRIEGANGDFVKRWATLPFLLSQPKFVTTDDPLWRESRSYELAQKFLFEMGNRPEALLHQARAMVTLLGLATGLLVFYSSRELFGPVGGLVSLALFVFSPAMLAFGGIVSTDMSITLTLFATTWCVWRLLHEVSVARVIPSLICVGLLVLAKPTALVIFPVAAVLVAVRLWRNTALALRWRAVRILIQCRRTQLGIIAALALIHAVCAWTAIWAHYEFRYAAASNPAEPGLRFYEPSTRDAVPLPLDRMLKWIERTHLLPEGFCVGIDNLLACDDALGSFMHGEWSLRGRWTFFPYAIWVKTPPADFLLLAAAAFVIWRAHRRGRGTELYALTPHLALVGCYLALALTEDINIGHRHVLPIYPALYVLAGAVSLGARSWWVRTGIAAVLALVASDSIAARPHYLAYFGPQAGGPTEGYRHLVDSSLDWGMDLPALRRWIDEHNPGGRERMFLAYFGTDRPSHYGIRATRLPGFLERHGFVKSSLAPGYYAISASLFQGVYTAAFGPWNPTYERLYHETWSRLAALEKSNSRRRTDGSRRTASAEWMNLYDTFENLRFARLCAWLRNQGGPPQQIGHSILVWKLNYASLEAALLGPPAELANTTGLFRRFRHFGPPPAAGAVGESGGHRNKM